MPCCLPAERWRIVLEVRFWDPLSTPPPSSPHPEARGTLSSSPLELYPRRRRAVYGNSPKMQKPKEKNRSLLPARKAAKFLLHWRALSTKATHLLAEVKNLALDPMQGALLLFCLWSQFETQLPPFFFRACCECAAESSCCTTCQDLSALHSRRLLQCNLSRRSRGLLSPAIEPRLFAATVCSENSRDCTFDGTSIRRLPWPKWILAKCAAPRRVFVSHDIAVDSADVPPNTTRKMPASINSMHQRFVPRWTIRDQTRPTLPRPKLHSARFQGSRPIVFREFPLQQPQTGVLHSSPWEMRAAPLRPPSATDSSSRSPPLCSFRAMEIYIHNHPTETKQSCRSSKPHAQNPTKISLAQEFCRQC